ncbi:methylisocitrate lyase [Frankia sp. R43]|uniref:methylisocitrate lyase n=1 Tax=Frankia sp. R43 TaxID=269536 RepID=UPI0006C9F77E|nr:methylisocitrate lyase [Frankia sp. R43]KPM51969.1 methylisocitrate lyase [Frankia sp. R43]
MSTDSPVSARRQLRERLDAREFLMFPGAFNPLSAMLIEDCGFPGVYVSGAVMAAELGLPDIGLTTLTEVASRVQQIARVTSLPVLVDADTGFGEIVNLARTVRLLEDAGAAAFHVEDQVNPKRCGHLDGKEVVDTQTAVRRIKACVAARQDPDMVIVARTDVRGVNGLDAAIERCQVLVAAGADALFPEAMASLPEFEAVRNAVNVPILANVTEFGKSELFSVSDLKSVGVNMAIYPVSLLRLAMGIAERALGTLQTEGTLADLVPQMQTRARLYQLLDYASYNQFDEAIFTYGKQP